MPLILPGNSGSATAATGFNVSNSLRFNRGSADHLTRTVSASSTTKATYSVWLKRGFTFGSEQCLYAIDDGTNEVRINFTTADTIQVFHYAGGYTYQVATNRVFRDPSAFYNIIIVVDTTQGTDTNRVKIYVNGVQETSLATTNYPGQNTDSFFFQSATLYLGVEENGSSNPIDGYIAEHIVCQGQALAPTSFGEFDDSGIWKPIDGLADLTFGNDGFYLQFKEAGTSANASGMGADTSGNTNHFAVNNLTAVDQSTDTCTNNFCTLNPLTKRPTANGTIAEGNLQYTASTGDSSIFGTMAIPPGMKVYFEVKLVSNTAQNAIGIHNVYDPGGTFVKGGSASGMYSFKPRGSGSVTQYFNNGSSTNTSIDNPANDTILGVAIDNANGQIHYHIAGTYINSSDPTDNDPVALVTGFGGATEQYLHFSLDTTTTQPSNQFNFGSPPYSESGGESDADGHGNFNQAVPSGYFALCTKNLAEYG